jgi:hypothetical protein
MDENCHYLLLLPGTSVLRKLTKVTFCSDKGLQLPVGKRGNFVKINAV